MEFSPREVYRVRSEEDPTALIALDVKVRGDTLTWFDTSRDRGHPIKSRNEDGGVVTFETETGFTYRFEPLTKATYDAEVKGHVELSPDFESTEAMKKFYLGNFLGLEPEDV